MMKINSLYKIDFIKSADLLYAQRTGIFKEDELFNNLTSDFKLNKPFDYQIAFLKYNEIYHCFLTPVCKLKKSRFCFPEPLIFQALFDERLIKESDYCVLNLYDKTLYLYFYQEGKFSNLKKIENFNPENIGLFFEQNRFIELLKHYESKLLLHRDLDIIKHYFSSQIKCLNLNDLLDENSLLKLSSYSIKNLDQNCNFIKYNKIKISFSLKIILLFIFSLSLSMIILLFGDFIEYKQNKEIQNKNFIIQEEISKLKQDRQRLLKNIQDLNLTLSDKILSIQQQTDILSIITKEINLDKNKTIILNQIISWLNSNGLKIINLEFEQTKIILSFINENHFKTALKNLNSTFKILDKNEETFNIILNHS
ncbi:TPA: hypothetical protein RTH40_000722 [Campylobacter jejuni]|nr:hypothetical protein [Campylobacter jejuni]